MSTIYPITSFKSYNEISKSKNGTYIIKLYTPWCSKCKKLENILEEKKPSNCKVYKINID
jgi:thiol-disulfide isomerase/thioredoxin